MDLFLIPGIKYGGAIKIEYVINDDGEGPNPFDTSIIKTWLSSAIVYSNGQKYTHKRVGDYDQVLPIFSIAYQPMKNIGFYDESSEEVSFPSENSGIVIESGEVFTYRRLSEK